MGYVTNVVLRNEEVREDGLTVPEFRDHLVYLNGMIAIQHSASCWGGKWGRVPGSRVLPWIDRYLPKLRLVSRRRGGIVGIFMWSRRRKEFTFPDFLSLDKKVPPGIIYRYSKNLQ